MKTDMHLLWVKLFDNSKYSMYFKYIIFKNLNKVKLCKQCAKIFFLLSNLFIIIYLKKII